MWKRMLLSAMMVTSASSRARAQDPYEIRWGIASATSAYLDIDVQMRNRQGYGASSVFHLMGFRAMYLGGNQACQQDCDWLSANNVRWDGAFIADPFTVNDPTGQFKPQTVRYSPFLYDVSGSSGTVESYEQQSLLRRPGSDSYGILGCTLPTVFGGGTVYLGRNCIDDGIDGWFTATLRLGQFVGFPRVDFTALKNADFSFTGLGDYTVVTPEPTTFVLMSIGLLVAGIVVRRSQRT